MKDKEIPKLKKNSVYGICLTAFVAIICIFGQIVLASASYYSATYHFGDALYFVKKQLVALALGIGAFFGVRALSENAYEKAVYPLLILSFLLLGLIFIPGLGVESYGAKRWLNLGFFTMQPSEISKFGLVFFSALMIDKKGTKKASGFLAILFVGLTFCVLLLLEPNMSVTVLTALITLCMLFVGGAKPRVFFFLLIPMLAVAVLLIVLEPYRMQRLYAFLDPWQNPKGEGYQLIQSYYALGSGGWFGVGFLKGRQKYMFLPFAESDFIFSIVGEEFGYFGAVVLLLIYAGVAICGYKIAANAENRFQGSLAFGITSVLILQTLLNVAVVSGAIPPTGIPLPFMSYGGSSLVCYLAAMGVLVSIDRSRRTNIEYRTAINIKNAFKNKRRKPYSA